MAEVMKDLLLTEQECYQATIAYAHRLGRKVSRGTHAGDRALCEAQLAKVLKNEKSACCYCDKKPDGAMLVMGNSMAHDTCVIQELNELLDPDFEGKGEPRKIVAKVPVLKHRMDKKEIQLLYCKWCPHDCQGLTEEETLGCLASGGFVDDLILPRLDRPELREKIWAVIAEQRTWAVGTNKTFDEGAMEGARKILLLFPNEEAIRLEGYKTGREDLRSK